MLVLIGNIAPSPKTGTKETRLEQTNQEQGRDAPSCCRSKPVKPLTRNVGGFFLLGV